MDILPHGLPLFTGISDPGFVSHLDNLPLRRIPKGFALFDEGDFSAEIFGILSGSVEMVRKSESGEWIRVAKLGPGEIFGEFAHLSGSPRSAGAVTLEDSVLLEIKPTWLDEAAANHPALLQRLVELYRKRGLVNTLRGTKLFASLTAKQLEQLSQHMEYLQLKDEDLLIRQGDTDVDLFVIKKGRVQISRRQEGKTLSLAELGTGEVVGEMAIVNGEPRSASVAAVGLLEVMTLSGAKFAQVLKQIPEVLRTVEDLYRARGQATRQALEAVVGELVGKEWRETEELDGIQVEKLSIPVTLRSPKGEEKGKLTRVCRTHWTIQRTETSLDWAEKDPLELSLATGGCKELEKLGISSPLAGSVHTPRANELMVLLDPGENGQRRAIDLVTAMAKARVRLLIYPEYDVSSLDLSIDLALRDGREETAKILEISQTSVRLRPSSGEWPRGTTATLRIQTKPGETTSVRAICLEKDEAGVSAQFEYDTGAEKTSIEALVRDFSRKLGFGSLAESAPVAPPPAARRSAPILTRHYRNPQQLMQSYMSLVDTGRLRIESKERLETGTSVRIQLSVSSPQGTRRFSLAGTAVGWKDKANEIKPDASINHLKERIEEFGKALLEARTKAEWNKRKEALSRSGLLPGEWGIKGWMKAAGLFALVGGGTYLVLHSWKPEPEAVVPRRNSQTTTHVKPRVSKPKGPQVASKRVGRCAKRTSTRAEKMNYYEEKLTPSQIKEHMEFLIQGTERQLRHSRLSLQLENDPRKRDMLEKRIQSVESGLMRLRTVDPNDQKTWFFLEGREGKIKLPTDE